MNGQNTLVLGASQKEHRYSNRAIKELVNAGFDVLAVGIRKGEAHGIEIETAWPSGIPIDTITLYLGKPNQVPYYESILNSGPRRVIFNPGTENIELEKLLGERGISHERSCTLVLLATNQY